MPLNLYPAIDYLSLLFKTDIVPGAFSLFNDLVMEVPFVLWLKEVLALGITSFVYILDRAAREDL